MSKIIIVLIVTLAVLAGGRDTVHKDLRTPRPTVTATATALSLTLPPPTAAPLETTAPDLVNQPCPPGYYSIQGQPGCFPFDPLTPYPWLTGTAPYPPLNTPTPPPYPPPAYP